MIRPHWYFFIWKNASTLLQMRPESKLLSFRPMWYTFLCVSTDGDSNSYRTKTLVWTEIVLVWKSCVSRSNDEALNTKRERDDSDADKWSFSEDRSRLQGETDDFSLLVSVDGCMEAVCEVYQFGLVGSRAPSLVFRISSVASFE